MRRRRNPDTLVTLAAAGAIAAVVMETAEPGTVGILWRQFRAWLDKQFPSRGGGGGGGGLTEEYRGVILDTWELSQNINDLRSYVYWKLDRKGPAAVRRIRVMAPNVNGYMEWIADEGSVSFPVNTDWQGYRDYFRAHVYDVPEGDIYVAVWDATQELAGGWLRITAPG